jgi:cell division protease FtsH
MLNDAEAQATATLKEHKTEIEELISALETNETLDFDDIQSCLDPEHSVEQPRSTARSIAKIPAVRHARYSK